jgi:hypothetical protein
MGKTMKCIYYLTATLESTSRISGDLHDAGIKDWFIHVLSKDEAGLRKKKIHSSNYLEQIDLLRFGIIGAVLGLLAGVFAIWLMTYFKPFGSGVPTIVYVGIMIVLILFGAWEGGLTGVASENKKVSAFHDEIQAGNYLILIYTKAEKESDVKEMMKAKHPEAKLVAEDKQFFNPLSGLQRI